MCLCVKERKFQMVSPVDKQLEILITTINKRIRGEYIQDCFSDWICDMENTDWEYYEEADDQWKKDLLAKEADVIITALNQFAINTETEAYQQGMVSIPYRYTSFVTFILCVV